MRKASAALRHFRDRLFRDSGNDSGQAILEYILMLSLAVTIVGVFATGLRKALAAIWESMARTISAPCPGCPPPPDVRIR